MSQILWGIVGILAGVAVVIPMNIYFHRWLDRKYPCSRGSR